MQVKSFQQSARGLQMPLLSSQSIVHPGQTDLCGALLSKDSKQLSTALHECLQCDIVSFNNKYQRSVRKGLSK
jgi:hypothetical protein